ncbi:MAG: phosphatase PAP2 family protein [Parcubacteria group bacterium]
MFPNWAKNILFLLVYMISGLVLVIIIEGLMSGTELTPLNLVIEQVVAHIRTPSLTTFLVTVTKLGNPFMLSSAALLIAIILFVRGRVYDAVLFVTIMVVAIVSLTVLKNTFQITRPGSDILDVSGWSFPSGHATVATTFFFALALTFFGKIRSPWNRTTLIISSIVGAGLICFSRLYLGAHWTLDILAGIALGLLSVSFTVLVFNIFLEDKRKLRKSIDL